MNDINAGITSAEWYAPNSVCLLASCQKSGRFFRPCHFICLDEKLTNSPSMHTMMHPT